ncbi:hypothetical protein BGZ47_006918 [Haplosporangium gracile]|nr:hypothetical protein BGZ47_006918 [Haplosporangium gracile]
MTSSSTRPIISTSSSTSTPHKMQRSSPSSSIPSPPEQNIHYYNSSILVKGPHPSSTSLDHVFPNPRTKTLGPDDRSSDYYHHRRMNSNSNNNNEDDDASSVVDHNNNNIKNGNHSRINIANLLCTSATSSSNGPTRNTTASNPLPPPPPTHTTNVNSKVHGHHHDPKSQPLSQQQQQQLQQGLRAITEEADDHEVSPHHRHRQLPSYPDSRNGNHTSSHYNSNGTSNGNTNGSYPSSSTGPSREPLTQRVFAIDAPGAAPSTTSYYRPSTSCSTSSSASHLGTRPASFSAGSTSSSSSSGPLYSSAGSSSSSSSSSSSAAVYTSAPSRSKLLGPQQRSASWNTDRYQDYGHDHSSSTSYEQEQQRRTDRSKSDYALHQQNYGPYLDSSPPLSAATLPRTNGATTSSSSSSSLTSAPPSTSGVKMPASGAEPPASLYYQQPPSSQQTQHQQQHSQQQPSASTSALSSSPSTYPYSNIPSNKGHGTSSNVLSLSTASMASSSSRSMRDYPHAQSSDSSANDQLRRPTLPPPAALLSGADVKPQRIYGRDSTVDDLWPPHPRPNRVVPIDAPNEKRPFSFDGSAMLPPVLPPPTSSAPSSSSSSTLLPYSSGYSNVSMEQKQRRIYGIDAADVPSRFAAPPTLPSSYGSNGHYSKRPQDSSDGIEGGESRKRVFGRDSADTYQQRSYGPNTTAPPTSSAPSYGGLQSYGYNAPPPLQPSVSQNHHYSSSDMDRSSRYDEYKHRGWSNGQPSSSSSSSMAHGGPSYVSSNSTSSSRAYPRAQSPDIKPPSWYQDYANSVLPKPQTQPAYQQQRSDSGYYGGSNHSYQQQQQHHHSSSQGYGKSSSLAGIHEMDEDEEGNHHRSSKSSKRSKTGMGSSPSVHPFDTADPNSTLSSSSKSKKPKRIKNAAGQEDVIVMDDEFYAVKAKRKRANASQLSVLNAAFERSYFPSTEERLRLSKQCRMCPRTVQIWFQNKRQSVKARSEAMEAAVSGTAITDELLESRLQMLEEESNSGAGGMDGQKRSTGDMAEEDFEGDEESGSGEHGDHLAHHRHHNHSSGSSSKPRRSSGNTSGGSSNGNSHMTPSDAVMSALHIQLDGRSVDYFSRKRRATIAKMERNEQQKKEKEELQRKREQEQQLIIQQYQKHQQEQLQQQQQHQHQQEGQTVGHN